MISLNMLDDVTLLVKIGNRPGIQVRGDAPYWKYNPCDPLHKFLDSLDPATVSTLMADFPTILNPKNPRSKKSFDACIFLDKSC